MQREVESSAGQWASFDDGRDQLLRWIKEMEASQQAGLGLKNTLLEKKSMQHQYKVHKSFIPNP